MRRGQHSRTAEAAAAARAWHSRDADTPVFEDPWALALLSPRWRRRVTHPLLRWLQRRLLGELVSTAVGQIVIRSRYTEDALEDAMRRGIEQYVILGAGLDTFALRRPDALETLRVFEVDHPDTQAFKRARLEALGADVPEGLELVPVDFTREGVAEVLSRASHRADRRSFVSWLGTVPYLERSAVFETLGGLAARTPPGSEVVFDFAGDVERLPAAERAVLERLQRFASRRGEPLLTWGEPRPFLERVAAQGFEVVELLAPVDQERRYLGGGRAGLRTLPAAHLVRLRRV